MPFYGQAGPNPQRWDSWFWTRARPQRPDIGLGKKIGAGSGPIDSPRHSPVHPQRQCLCPLARDLLRFIMGRLGDLGWDSWFYSEVE